MVDISYAKITPEILTDQNTFNEEFFSIIDEIENQIMNNISIEEIANNYGFSLKIKKEYNGKDDDKLVKEIYNATNGEETNLLDKDDFFLIYEKTNIQKVLPDINDAEFLESVKNDLVEFKKFEVNKDLLSRIDSKEFDDADFRTLTDQKDLQNLKIESINDNKFLNNDSVKLLYSLSNGSFSLVVDEKNKIYLAKINNIEERNLSKNDETIKNFQIESNKNIKSNLYGTYDILLNDKYKIKINQNTLERVKNYFR